MPFTSLNKTINLLILGLVFIFIAIWESGNLLSPPKDALDQLGRMGSAGAASGALLLAALAVMFGMVIDRLGERFVHSPIARACEKGQPLLLFRLTRSSEGLTSYHAFRNAAFKVLSSTSWQKLGLANDSVYRSAIEGLVMSGSSKESCEWALQHYAASRLASGLLFITLFVELALTFAPIPHKGLVGVTGGLAIYGLLISVVDQHLYSYECLVREAFATLEPVRSPIAGSETQA
jgi:hypothetical protein